MAGVIGALKDMRDVVEEMARGELELVAACEAAVRHINDSTTREALYSFRDCHIQRWKDLAIELRRTGATPPLPSSVAAEAAKNVSLQEKQNDEDALLARLSDDALKAQLLFERWSRSAAAPARLRYLFRACAQSVRRQRSWMQKRLAVRARLQNKQANLGRAGFVRREAAWDAPSAAE